VAAYQRILLGGGEPRVDPHASFDRLTLDDHSWVLVARDWLRGADTVLDALIESVDWRQGRRRMYERMVDDPRVSRWYRPDAPVPHAALTGIRAALEDRFSTSFGGFGLNYYRDGNDSVAFHRDRELRHLADTLIAIVTLGATRPFLIRPLGGGPSRDVRPGSGDLLVMGGGCQLAWEHAVPKVARCGPRISVTLRWASKPGVPASEGPTPS
jgi:alkylated DNA repair dioxygenase AlkB